MTISTSCTSDAITRMKAMVCRYSMPKGFSRKYWINQVTTVATVITKVTAMPMPSAVSTFLETPMKGQIPRKRANTKLLTKMALIMMSKSWVIDPVLQQVAIGLTSGYKTGRLACQTLILFRKAIDWRLSEHI